MRVALIFARRELDKPGLAKSCSQQHSLPTTSHYVNTLPVSWPSQGEEQMSSTFSRKAAALVTAAACVAVSAHSASAQAKMSGTGFGMGYTDIGPTVGLGRLNGASASFGGRFEHAIKALPDL